MVYYVMVRCIEHPPQDNHRKRYSHVGFLEYKVTEEGYNVVGLVGSTADYAIYLEFGTSKMAARPFLRPVLENKKKEIVDKFVEGGK